MKLLFDQNISFRLVKRIIDLFPGSKQVRELGLENATDFEIFEYAKRKDYAIVTFDSDFCDLNTIKRLPTQNSLVKNRKYNHNKFRTTITEQTGINRIIFNRRLWLP